ncbi:MAG: hypothetical protein EHM23_17660 [Acidobacteria bacterium]|nr:MAG: hypothetical protein EHM23_17660 [Acidobacteriota bacterium]
MITYFVFGVLAYLILDYREVFETTELRYLMIPTDSPWVAVGPALQVFRGLLFAVVLYPLAAEFLRRKNGSLILWGLFLGLAILGTAGPSPGSFEGFLYTKIPLGTQLLGLLEVVPQTLFFSLGLVWWCQKPARWKNVVSGVFVGFIVLMSVAGTLLPRQI